MEKFSGPLSRRYGTALFETLSDLYGSHGQSSSGKVNEEFAVASNAIRDFSKNIDKKTIQIFKNQALSFTQKQELLKELMKFAFGSKEVDPVVKPRDDMQKAVSDCLFNFVSLVIKNKRFGLIHPIFDFYLKQADDYLGIVRASIVSARPMPKETVSNFETTISQNLQKRVVFSNFIDESLQCGFLIKVGSTNIDASLKSFLTKFQESVS